MPWVPPWNSPGPGTFNPIDEMVGGGPLGLEPARWDRYPLAPEIRQVAEGSFRHKNPPEIVGTGYVVESLEAALWAFHRTDDFRSGALAAVDLGDDADTTGAIFGQIAGAFYGRFGLPGDWLSKLHWANEITPKANCLLQVRY